MTSYLESPTIKPSPLTPTEDTLPFEYKSVWHGTTPDALIDCIDDPNGHDDFNVCCIRISVVFNVYTGIDSHKTVPSA